MIHIAILLLALQAAPEPARFQPPPGTAIAARLNGTRVVIITIEEDELRLHTYLVRIKAREKVEIYLTGRPNIYATVAEPHLLYRLASDGTLTPIQS